LQELNNKFKKNVIDRFILGSSLDARNAVC
jgi:hypothetical protein